MRNNINKDKYIPNRWIFVICVSVLFIIISYLNKTKANMVDKEDKKTNSVYTEYLNEQNYKEDYFFSKSIKDKACVPKTETKKIITENKPYETPKSQVIKAISNNDYKQIFMEDVFLGDSITTGLYIYKLIDEKNVCAKVGINSIQLMNEVKSIKIKKPKNIYILCGINDLIGNKDGNKFSSNYNNLINRIISYFPESNIYIQSILPVYKGNKESGSSISNENVKKFNSMLKELADSKKLKYLDLYQIIDCSDKKNYQKDGIHLKPDFYNLWLKYLVDNTK